MTRNSPRVWRFVALLCAWLLAAALVPIAASAQDGGEPPDDPIAQDPIDDEGTGEPDTSEDPPVESPAGGEALQDPALLDTGVIAPVPAGAMGDEAASTMAEDSDDQSPAPDGAGADDSVPTLVAEQLVINDDAPAAGGGAATSCVNGRWGHNPAGPVGYTGSHNVLVQAWDADTLSGDDLLGQVYTSTAGNFNICFPGTEPILEGSGALEVYLKFVHDSTKWRITNFIDDTYVVTTTTVSLLDGGTQARGNLEPTSSLDPMLRGYQTMNLFWSWVVNAPGHVQALNCFDPDDATCRNMRINWHPASTTGPDYDAAANEVDLRSADIDEPFIVVFEAARSMMDDVYNNNFPPDGDCSTGWNAITSAGCAWVRGFATYVASAQLNDPTYVFPSGSTFSVETPTWGTFLYQNGDTVPARVAGAMWDLHDSVNEASWDKWNENEYAQFDTFLDWNSLGASTVPDTFSMFWTDRIQDGLNSLNSGARASLYQNTIDYTYRNPLTAYVAQTIKTPTPGPHNYSLDNTTTGSFWSVVAIQDGAANYDLNYWDAVGLTTLRDNSFDTTEMDFIAMDFNHAATTVDYPQVVDVSGSADYKIEHYRGQGTFNFSGSQGTNFGANDLIWVRDTLVSTNTYFRVVPSAGDDLDLFLVDSQPTGTSFHYQDRNEVIFRSSQNAGAGQSEQFSTGNPAASDDMGIIVTNESGGPASFTLYRDTTASSGSVAINGGAASTSSPNVTLNLSAVDTHTGIADMRVCPDSSCNAEPWIPYSTSVPVVLPGSPGVKTVQVQFRNNAHMVRTVNDSITWAVPMCDGKVVTHLGNNLNNTLTGTSGNDVFLAMGGNDTIIGNGGDDTVCAGTGNDTITLGAGDDRVFGDAGEDDIRTFGGADYIEGGDNNDTIRAGSGPDEVHGGGGNDNVIAGDGPDRVYGDAGMDSLNGGAGEDVIEGGIDNDTLRGQGANDDFQGDEGDDTIRGHAGDDILRGAAGDDTLLASSGDDDLFGGPDDDTLWAGTGADFLNGGSGLDDFCHGGTDNDVDTDVNCEIRMKLP